VANCEGRAGRSPLGLSTNYSIAKVQGHSMLSQGYRSIAKYSQGHRSFAQGHLTLSQGH